MAYSAEVIVEELLKGNKAIYKNSSTLEYVYNKEKNRIDVYNPKVMPDGYRTYIAVDQFKKFLTTSKMRYHIKIDFTVQIKNDLNKILNE